MARGRPSGAVSDKLAPFSKFTEAGGGTTLSRFAVLGARSVVILWKADSGTPTITIGAYVHPNATRETTLANLDLVLNSNGATVAAGQNNYIFASNAAGANVANAAEVPLGVQELDVQVAGNVVNLDVMTIILY